jgi:Fe-S-cluster containining protein
VTKLKTRLSGFISFLKGSDLPNDKGACIGHYCGEELADALGYKSIPIKHYSIETDSDFSNIILTDLNYISFDYIISIIYEFECFLRDDGITTLIHFKQGDDVLEIDGKRYLWKDPSPLMLLPIIYDDRYVSVYKCSLFPEEFNCVQCGNCCKNISGGYCFTPTARDIYKWSMADRDDILEYCRYYPDIYGWDAWIDPVEGVYVSKCPWRKKVKNRYECTIHDIKPDHCKIWYPVSARTARRVGCRAWEESPWAIQKIVDMSLVFGLT